VEGDYTAGTRCLIIEDVVTTGSSILETAESLRQHNLIVEDAIVILDRGQGGDENLDNHKINMEALLEVQPILNALESENLITLEQKVKVEDFLSRTASKFDP
jgi:orotate phosphoribosyltransferase